jgi:hypothetical protein
MREVLLWLLRHDSLSIHRNLPCCLQSCTSVKARARNKAQAPALYSSSSPHLLHSIALSLGLSLPARTPFDMVFVTEQGQRFTRADVDKEKHLDFGRHPRGPRAGSSSLHNCTIHGATSRPAVRLRLDTRVVELYGCQEHQATRALVRSE